MWQVERDWLCSAEGDPAPAAGGGEALPAERLPPPTALTGGADGAGDDDIGDEGAAPAWSEDWRKEMAGGDAALEKRLARLASPRDVAINWAKSENRIRAGRAVAPQPPEEATDVELAAWRKQVGIPETPAGYEIAFPQGVQPSERDKEELGQFLEFMHERHVRPEAAKAAFEFYMTASKANAEHAAEEIHEATLRNIADLRNEFPGREYKRSINIANNYLDQYFDEAAIDTLRNTRMPDGVALFDWAPFVKGIINMARAVASDDELISGDGAGGGKSNDEEFKELARLPRLTPDQHARMTQLAQARLSREQRAARG